MTTYENQRDFCKNILYDSFPDILDSKVKSIQEKKRMFNYYIGRWKTTNNIMNHLILNLPKHYKFNESLLSFIVNEIESTKNNKDKQNIPGEQQSIFLMKQTIQDKPFECIMKLSSTKGRLYAWYNLRKFDWLPNFINQTVYKELFGFTYSKDGQWTSKF